MNFNSSPKASVKSISVYQPPKVRPSFVGFAGQSIASPGVASIAAICEPPSVSKLKVTALVFDENCNECGICVDACPLAALELEE